MSTAEEVKALEKKYSDLKSKADGLKANLTIYEAQKTEVDNKIKQLEQRLKDEFGINSMMELDQKIETLRSQVESAVKEMETKLA